MPAQAGISGGSKHLVRSSVWLESPAFAGVKARV
jgi:hypothetical protein